MTELEKLKMEVENLHTYANEISVCQSYRKVILLWANFRKRYVRLHSLINYVEDSSRERLDELRKELDMMHDCALGQFHVLQHSAIQSVNR